MARLLIIFLKEITNFREVDNTCLQLTTNVKNFSFVELYQEKKNLIKSDRTDKSLTWLQPQFQK